MFKKYMDYLKDNPRNLWFKRKLFGWGWTPVRPQGWAVIFIYILLLLKVVIKMTNPVEITLSIIILTSLLIFICYKKGESPRWQWGLPKDS